MTRTTKTANQCVVLTLGAHHGTPSHDTRHENGKRCFYAMTGHICKKYSLPPPSFRVPSAQNRQATCPAGTYCQGGVSLPCPAGTYGSRMGLYSPTCSGLCPAGRYCPAGTFPESSDESDEAITLLAIGIACPAGRYGVEGMRNAACTGPCREGFYCPQVGAGQM